MGIELVPRDYDMNSQEPFRKVDIVSLVPVHKVMHCFTWLTKDIFNSVLACMNWTGMKLNNPYVQIDYCWMHVFSISVSVEFSTVISAFRSSPLPSISSNSDAVTFSSRCIYQSSYHLVEPH